MMQNYEIDIDKDNMLVDDSSVGSEDTVSLSRFEDCRQEEFDNEDEEAESHNDDNDDDDDDEEKEEEGPDDEEEQAEWTWKDLASRPIKTLNGWNVRVITRHKLAHLIQSSNGSDVDSEKIARQVNRLLNSCRDLIYKYDSEHFYALHFAVTVGASLDVIKVLADAFPHVISYGYERTEFYGTLLHEKSPQKAAFYLAADPAIKHYLINRAVEHVCSELKYEYSCAVTSIGAFFESHCGQEDVITCFLEKVPAEFARTRSEFRYREGKELPLNVAIQKGAPPAVVKLLVEAYPKVLLKKNRRGRTPLHAAISHHEGPISRDLIEPLVSPEVVRVKNKCGCLPLHQLCACHNGRPILDIEAVRMLVELYPESLREANDDGWIPLHLACFHARRESIPAIRYMIEQLPESITALNNKGETALHCAQTAHPFGEVNDTLPVVELFSELYPESFHVACTENGFIPLHVACASYADDQYDRVRNLVEAFPEGVDRLDNDGRTPLHILCKYKYGVNDHLQISEYVVDKNPELLHLQDNDGCTPLHLLCMYGRYDQLQITKYMANKSPELLRVTDNAGHTPLHLACKHKAIDAAILFLACKRPEAFESSLDTPLHLACDQSRPILSSLEILLSFSVSAVKAKNAEGQTPLHLLSGNGASKDCLLALLETSPNLAQERDNEGRTPLRAAIDGYRKESEYVRPECDDDDDDGDDYTYERTRRLHRYGETIRCLLEVFPEGLSVVDNEGVSPLMAAAEADLSLDCIFELVSFDPIVCLGMLR